MPSQPKYQAKHVYWDAKNKIVRAGFDIEIYRCYGKLKLPPHIWRFDSQHEFKVYLELVRMYGEHRIERQFSVPIFPISCCYARGKSWKVDFALVNPNEPSEILYYIEAKGAFLTEFALTLAAFEQHQYERFERIKIIFPNRLPSKNNVVKSLLKSPFKDNLLTLSELKERALL